MFNDMSKRPKLKAVPTSQSLFTWAIILVVVFVIVALIATKGLSNISTGRLSVVFSVGLLVLVGEVFIIKGYLRARDLDRFGETTEGKIIDSWVNKDSDGDKTYYIAYQFGDDVRVRQSVKAQTYDTLLVGTKVPVRYLPDDPTCSRMEIKA